MTKTFRVLLFSSALAIPGFALAGTGQAASCAQCEQCDDCEDCEGCDGCEGCQKEGAACCEEGCDACAGCDGCDGCHGDDGHEHGAPEGEARDSAR